MIALILVGIPSALIGGCFMVVASSERTFQTEAFAWGAVGVAFFGFLAWLFVLAWKRP
ncbi:hypothetical protein OP10G_4383 [Fimbriimonas ginsengisoli Gsoil 348]|uniref:Uncharacterized protein n=1 Tax=Fimbriimonas ginsengisoli Gsoil 348 TaxID=661478 RepID=A0A068NWC0_FIMGI|nr:hypothetical protein OP10G_4383 [Fimbriimonas ginsengisoli Gsoil 348]